MNHTTVIVLLGGGVIRETDGTWRTTRFDEQGDRAGVSGDQLRVEAVAALYHQDTTRRIIVSGGKGQFRDLPGRETIASVNARELVALGVPAAAIILEDKSGTTMEQLHAVQPMCGEKTYARVILVTNRWHVPRTRAMIETDVQWNAELASGRVTLVSAEDVLIAHDPGRWKDMIDQAYASPAMEARLKKEAEGIAALRAGTYQFVTY